MGRLFDSKAVLVPLPEGAVFLDLKVGGEPLRDSLTVYQDLELERRDGLWSGGGGGGGAEARRSLDIILDLMWQVQARSSNLALQSPTDLITAIGLAEADGGTSVGEDARQAGLGGTAEGKRRGAGARTVGRWKLGLADSSLFQGEISFGKEFDATKPLLRPSSKSSARSRGSRSAIDAADVALGAAIFGGINHAGGPGSKLRVAHGKEAVEMPQFVSGSRIRQDAGVAPTTSLPLILPMPFFRQLPVPCLLFTGGLFARHTMRASLPCLRGLS